MADLQNCDGNDIMGRRIESIHLPVSVDLGSSKIEYITIFLIKFGGPYRTRKLGYLRNAVRDKTPTETCNDRAYIQIV